MIGMWVKTSTGEMSPARIHILGTSEWSSMEKSFSTQQSSQFSIKYIPFCVLSKRLDNLLHPATDGLSLGGLAVMQWQWHA